MRSLPAKFDAINKSGRGKPAIIVAMQSDVNLAEQTYQTDWSACYSYSLVDWTPPYPATGDLVLEQQTDPRDEQQGDGSSWIWLYTGYPQQVAWQSFKQSVGVPRKIVSIFMAFNNTGIKEYSISVTLYGAGMNGQIGEPVTIAVPIGLSNQTFSFDSQNILLASDAEYWFKVAPAEAIGSGILALAMSTNTNAYTKGQMNVDLGFGWNVGIGDVYFNVHFTGQHNYYYADKGTFYTQVMSLATVPTQDGEFVFDDVMPTGTSITYQAWCVNTPGYTFPNSWEDYGIVKDGDTITNRKKFWRLKATFQGNIYRDETPIISGLRVDFSNYEKYCNRGGFGLPVLVQNVSNLSMEIDLFKGSTIGQINIAMQADARVRRWLAVNRPKNKLVKVKAGFLDDRPYEIERNLIEPEDIGFQSAQWFTEADSVQITPLQMAPDGIQSATRIRSFGWSTHASIYKYFLDTSKPAQQGSAYCFSFYVMVNTNTCRIDGGLLQYSSVYSADGQWHQVQFRTTCTSATDGYPLMLSFDTSQVSMDLDITVWHPQIEKNNFTGWQDPVATNRYNADLTANRFTEQDFIDYRWGQIDDYEIEDDVVTITMKDYSKEWKEDIPRKWTSVTDDVTYTGSHHCDIIKDVLLNRIGVRDSRVDGGSLSYVKDQTSGYTATHKITGNPSNAADLIDQLRTLLAAYFIYTPTGSIRIKRWDPNEAPVMVLTDKEFITKKWQANANELYNRCAHYFAWQGSGDDTKNYSSFAELVNSDSMVQYQEIATFTFKDQWTTATGSWQVADLQSKVIARYGDPAPDIFQCEVDRRFIALEPGDPVTIKTRCAPSSDGTTDVTASYQCTRTELNFMNDRIELTFKKAKPS